MNVREQPSRNIADREYAPGWWLEAISTACLRSDALANALVDPIRATKPVTVRYGRFGDSVYLLEPDVKSGAGGLRDMCIATWAARARFRTASINDLLRVGFLSPLETTEISKAEEFLWQVRNQLHRHANRRSDRLTFDEQEALADFMGYRERLDTLPADEAAAAGVMVEAFMSEYYRHARVVLRVRDQITARAMPVLQRKRPRVVDLGNGLESFNDQLTFSRFSELETTPALALRLYATGVGQPKRFASGRRLAGVDRTRPYARFSAEGARGRSR